MQVLREAFPDHALLGEEGGRQWRHVLRLPLVHRPPGWDHKLRSQVPLLWGVRGSPGEGGGSGRGCCGVCWGSRHLDPENLHRCGHALIELAGQRTMHPACLQPHSVIKGSLCLIEQCCCSLSCIFMHAGAKGKGAYMNGQRIHVSQCKDVGMSLLVRHPSQQNLVAQQYVLVRIMQIHLSSTGRACCCLCSRSWPSRG